MKYCRHCGKPLEPSARFCSGCGQSVFALPISESVPVKPVKRRKKWFVPTIAIVVVACLVLGAVLVWPRVQAARWTEWLRGSMDEEVMADRPASGQPAFLVTPAEGITVSGEANALDKKRRFTAKQMTDQELFSYSEKNAADESVHLAGFTLDAGMKAGERFDQPVTLTLALDQLGIPESICQSGKLVLTHVRADGVTEEIPSQVSDGVMTARISSNSLFIIKGVTSGVVAIRGILVRRKFFGFTFKHDTIFRSFNLGSTYKVYWPAAMPPADPTEVDRIAQRLDAVYASYGIDMTKGFEQGINALSVKKSGGWDAANYKKSLIETISKDPEYKACMDILEDQEWVRKHFLPAKVAVIIDCLELAEEYLFEANRGFRRPTHVIDVLVAGDGGIDWPEQHGRDSFGAAVNEVGLNPYLHLNANKLIIDALGTSGQQLAVISEDNMLLTAVHELFHIVQSNMVTIDYKDRRWFSEATAVMLEREAYEYFKATEWIRTGEQEISFTPRDRYGMCYLSSYASPSHWVSGERSFDDYDMHYGYAAAYFLEYLRDNAYRGQSNRFLPDLMMRYGYASDTTGYSSLVSVLGGAPANVSKAYRDFMAQPRPEIIPLMVRRTVKGTGDYASLFSSRSVPLSRETPFRDIETRYLPLSLTPHLLNITLPAERNARLLVQLGSDAMQQSDWFQLTASCDADGTNRKTADRQGYSVLGEISQSGPVVLFEACSNVTLPSGGLNALGGGYTVLLLVQPEKPVVSFKDERIIIDVPGKSALAKAGHVHQVQYTVVEPDGTAHQFRVPVDKTKLAIDEMEVNFNTTEPGATFKFFYTELVRQDKGKESFVSGPDGIAAEYSVNMPTGIFAGPAHWQTLKYKDDKAVYSADLIDPCYVYVTALDDDQLRISIGRSEADAASRAQVCVYDDEYGLYSFYDWVDDRYACYEFMFSHNEAGENMVEGTVIFYAEKEHVNSIFTPLESFKIYATELRR
jgi:hypothetical protein